MTLAQRFWRMLAPSEVAKERRFGRIVAAAEKRGTELADGTDAELTDAAEALHTGAEFDTATLTEWCAVVREAAHRGIGERPFDVQLLGAARMLAGDVVEMATGEGKTLAGALAAAGYVMQGRRVHVITINDYLARRDAEWMAPIFELLGVTVGWIDATRTPRQRREAYAAQVCYLAISEAGFDVLRDRQATDPSDVVSAEPDVALIDEADSVLVDEAQVPLVLAGEIDSEVDDSRLAELVATLREDEHYEADPERRNVYLTTEGATEVSKALGGIDLYSAEHISTTLTRVNVALHAHALVHKDVHYIVADDRIALINPARGRVATRQRWPDGLHAAIEAKEGVTRTAESDILDSLTIRAVVSRYRTLCGMTGTAVAAADPLRDFYSLRATVIPPHRPCVRVDEPDRVYRTARQRDDAVLDEIREQHAEGRPILVATLDVSESERLSERLTEHDLPHTVLNARNDADEAAVIAEAGQAGAITVSTQLAGRGTDIRLGGTDETDHDTVAGLGGLYVLGTGHQPSRRLDDQLRGRAGRQGDPGYSVFFVSLEDDLLEQYGGDFGVGAHAGPDGLILSPDAAHTVRRAHLRQEGDQHRVLELTGKYHYPVDKQREFLGERRDVLLRTDAARELFAERCPDRLAEFAELLSDERLDRLCRKVALFQLDRLWSDHLALAAQLRDGLQLRALTGKQDPLTEFLREMFTEFKGFTDRVDDAAVEAFEELPVTADVDLDDAGMNRPSATWTYLVQDNPSGNEFDRAVRGMSRLFRRKTTSTEEDD